MFSIQWIEEGGPPVAAPTRKGFGHLVIGTIAESALAGKVAIGFPGHGSRLETVRACHGRAGEKMNLPSNSAVGPSSPPASSSSRTNRWSPRIFEPIWSRRVLRS